MLEVKRRRELQNKVAFYLGDRGNLACGLKDGRWWWTLDKETFVGPYRRRIQAQRALTDHLAKQR